MYQFFNKSTISLYRILFTLAYHLWAAKDLTFKTKNHLCLYAKHILFCNCNNIVMGKKTTWA